MTVLSFDTETRGLNWWDPDEQAFLASWADARSEYAAPLIDAADKDRFTDIVKRADTLVAHNLSFDTHMIRETVAYDLIAAGHTVHDTDLMSRVLYPEGQRKGDRGGHGLKNLATVWLRADAKQAEDAIAAMAKEIGLRTLKQTGAYYDVWRAYPEVMEQYARMDARYTYDLFEKFQRELTNNDAARRIYGLEMDVAPILIRAEQKGIAVDQGAVEPLWKQYDAQRAVLHDQLQDELGEGALSGEGSQDALREALLMAGVPLHRKTETGILSTDKFALAEFEDSHEVVHKLLEWRTVERFLNTYLGPMRGREIVHTSFNQCGAWTGRMSSRRPNMQNIPQRAGKEIRSVFVPRPDHAFVVVDYETIEVRLLAYYLGDPEFRAMIESGHDMHSWMASQIWGGSPEQYAKGTPGEKQRKTARHTLFAVMYGAGAPRVADMNKITKDEARALIAKIKSALPNYRRLNKRIRNKIENVGYVNTLFGRKQVVNKDKAYVGLNALVQGSAADIMKQGLVNVDEAVRDLGGQPLLVVHDEVVIEVPIENAQECLRRTEEALVEAAPDLSPALSVEGSVVTTNYADA